MDLALAFLSGNYDLVLDDLKAHMEKASEELNFEEAAKYRDLLTSVRQIAQKQKMTEGVGEDKDILGIAMDYENADADAVSAHSLRIHETVLRGHALHSEGHHAARGD